MVCAGRTATAGCRGTAALRLLHETVDLEPVGPSAITGATLGHANHKAFPETAGLASCPILLVDDTSVVVFTFLDDGLVVAGAAKAGFASLAGEGAEMKPSRRLITNSTGLVLLWIQLINLEQWKGFFVLIYSKVPWH